MANQISLRTGRKLFGADPNDRSAPVDHIPEYGLPGFPKEELDRIVRREASDVALEFRGRVLKVTGLGDGRYTVEYGDTPDQTEAPVEQSESPARIDSSGGADESVEQARRATSSNNVLLTVALISAALSLASLGLQLSSNGQRKVEEDRIRDITRDLSRRIDELALVIGKKPPSEPPNFGAMQSELKDISNRLKALEQWKADNVRPVTKPAEKSNRQRREPGN